MILSSDVLPAPFGPTCPMISDGSRVRLMLAARPNAGRSSRDVHQGAAGAHDGSTSGTLERFHCEHSDPGDEDRCGENDEGAD